LSRPLDTEPATLYERFLAWEGAGRGNRSCHGEG